MEHISEIAYISELTLKDKGRSLYAVVKNQKGTEIINCSVKADKVVFDCVANKFTEVNG